MIGCKCEEDSERLRGIGCDNGASGGGGVRLIGGGVTSDGNFL